MSHTLEELATYVGGKVTGDKACEITSVASLTSARSGQICFFTGGKHKAGLQQTAASAVVLSASHADSSPVACIIIDNPHLAFAKIAALLHPSRQVVPGIHATACIDDSALIDASASIGANCVIGANTRIAENVHIGAGCVIGDESAIGDNSYVYANVTIYGGVQVGVNAIIHSGAVLGSDGFGMANDNGRWEKVPQLGGVIIGDDVEVGANTTIDRGALDDTVIGNGVKLDNQIQIAHNVHIGDHTAIAACVGIAGSAVIGRYCTVAGAVVILGQLEIVDNVHITATSLVTRSIKHSGAYSSGTPLMENAKWHRNFVRFSQLDDMAKRLKRIEKQLAGKDGE